MKKTGTTVYLIEDGTSVAEELKKDPMIKLLSCVRPSEGMIDNICAAAPRVIVYCCEKVSTPFALKFIKSLHSKCKAAIIVVGNNAEVALSAKAAGAYEYMFRNADFNKYISDLLFNIRIASVAGNTGLPKSKNKREIASSFITKFSGIIALGASCGGTEATSTEKTAS